jgi:hypothetical protein
MSKHLMKQLDRLEGPISLYAEDPAIRQGMDDMRLAINAEMTTANETQIGGDHYKAKSIQPWDFIAANQLGYFEGNIVKYVSRWRDKGGINDLKKARHYLDKLIELEDNQS